MCRLFLAAAASLLALVGVAHGQAFPTKQITLVVPFSAGGPTDTLARILAERMSRTLGQTVVVDNTTGAAGTVGVGRVARAAPAFNYPHLLENDKQRTICCVRGISHDSLSGTESQRSGANGWGDQRLG